MALSKHCLLAAAGSFQWKRFSAEQSQNSIIDGQKNKSKWMTMSVSVF